MSGKPKKMRRGKTAARRRKVKASVRPKGRTKRTVKMRAKRGAAAKTRPVEAAQTDGIDSLVAASARALRLPIDPAWLGGVKFNLQLILRLAALVDEFPLPDDAEPAPVFHA
jgi:Protein of unknown function (DUF4089)